MADIAQIKIQNSTYNFKDATTRGNVTTANDNSASAVSTASGKVGKDGTLADDRTMSGALGRKTNAIDITTIPSTTQAVNLSSVLDTNGNKIGSVEAIQNATTGNLGIKFLVRRTGTGSEDNYINFCITPTGERITEVSNAAMWRDYFSWPEYTYSTTDLTAGTSALATGKVYFVYS